MKRNGNMSRSVPRALLLLLLMGGALGLFLAGWAQRAVPADVAVPVEETPEEGWKLVALTFDDGPKGKWTTKLLDGLAERGAKATFFVLGTQVADDPEKVCRMVREGHQVGIHCYDHLTALTDLCQADFDAQVGRTRELLCSLLGERDFCLRPPYGAIDASVRAWAQAPLVLWSVDSEDWLTRDAGTTAAYLIEEIEDGDIVLMHDIFPESVDAALQVVDALHQQGFCFVTVDQLMEERGIVMENGESYFFAHPA